MLKHSDLQILTRDQLRAICRANGILESSSGKTLTAATKDELLQTLLGKDPEKDPVAHALAEAITSSPKFWASIDAHLEDKKPIRVELPPERQAGIEVPEADATLPNTPVLKRMAMYAAAGLDFGITGPAGCGKSTMVRMIARSLGYRFGMISCAGGVQEHHFLGRQLPAEGGEWVYRPTQFVDFYETPPSSGGGWNGSIFLIDEIDAIGDPQVMLALNAGLDDNRQLSVPQREANPLALRAPNTVIVWAANTFLRGADPVYVGRIALDGATADRFVGKIIQVTYDNEFETKAATKHPDGAKLLAWIKRVRGKIAESGLRRVLSTRALQHGIVNLELGFPLAEVYNTLLVGWTGDELELAKAEITK